MQDQNQTTIHDKSSIDYDDLFILDRSIQNQMYDILKDFLKGKKLREIYNSYPKKIFFLLEDIDIKNDDVYDIIFSFEHDKETKVWNRNNKIIKIDKSFSLKKICEDLIGYNIILRSIYENKTSVLL